MSYMSARRLDGHQMGKRTRETGGLESTKSKKDKKKKRKRQQSEPPEGSAAGAAADGTGTAAAAGAGSGAAAAGEPSAAPPRPGSSAELPVDEGWAPLADRLNPTRKAFDAALKERWATMSKKQRKKLQKQDRESIAALKARGQSIQHAFTPDPNDHCETSPTAYRHIAPMLRLVAAMLGKTPASLRIWDPYYCAGSVQRHLKAVGFPCVHNANEDFYAVIASGCLPEHDVLVTNPPYTADHVERFLRFAVDNGKPWLLLVPD